MNHRPLPAAALVLTLATFSAGAHAAWGHGDYAHVEAYRHLQAAKASHGDATDPAASAPTPHPRSAFDAIGRTMDDDARDRPQPAGRS